MTSSAAARLRTLSEPAEVWASATMKRKGCLLSSSMIDGKKEEDK
jgi:hypothetical protein